MHICAKSLLSCLTLQNSSPQCSFVHGDFPGKNTGVDCHVLLQGIFWTQGSNPHLLRLLHWHSDSLWLVPPGKPRPYGRSILNYFRTHQIVSKKLLTIYIPTNNGQGFLFLPTTPTLVIFSLFMVDILTTVR